MKKVAWSICIVGLLCILLLMGLLLHIRSRWLPQMKPAEPQEEYPVFQHDNDTLLVLMIGDSWAGIHSETKLDTMAQRLLSDMTGCYVRFVSKGKGGAKSKEIYSYMFKSAIGNSDEEQGYCTQELIEQHPDYCIVIAGINDAAANLGSEYYCQNYRLIIEWLLACDIRPVIVEVPDVNIKKLYAGKPLYDMTIDWIRSLITHCEMYDVCEYREALKLMLSSWKEIEGRVLYLSIEKWNKNGYRDHQFYLEDEIHLNRKGYEKLDSTLSRMIAHDVLKYQSLSKKSSVEQ